MTTYPRSLLERDLAVQKPDRLVVRRDRIPDIVRQASILLSEQPSPSSRLDFSRNETVTVATNLPHEDLPATSQKLHRRLSYIIPADAEHICCALPNSIG